MPANVAEVLRLFDEFKKLYAAGDAQLEACQKLMGQIKVAMLDFSSLVRAIAAAPLPAACLPACKSVRGARACAWRARQCAVSSSSRATTSPTLVCVIPPAATCGCGVAVCDAAAGAAAGARGARAWCAAIDQDHGDPRLRAIRGPAKDLLLGLRGHAPRVAAQWVRRFSFRYRIFLLALRPRGGFRGRRPANY